MEIRKWGKWTFKWGEMGVFHIKCVTNDIFSSFMIADFQPFTSFSSLTTERLVTIHGFNTRTRESVFQLAVKFATRKVSGLAITAKSERKCRVFINKNTLGTKSFKFLSVARSVHSFKIYLSKKKYHDIFSSLY